MSEQKTGGDTDNAAGQGQDPTTGSQDGSGGSEQNTKQSQDDAGDSTGQGDGDDAGNGKSEDPEVRKLKRENQRLRRERNAANEAAEEARRKELSEAERAKEDAERAKAEAEQARKEAQALRVETAVTAAASKLKFHDPADALALLPEGAVTIGDDGTVEGVEDALKELAERKPHLVNRSGGDAGDVLNSGAGKGNPRTESDLDRARRLGLARGGTGRRISFSGGGVVSPKTD
jgi:hypothetical protein